MSIDGFDVRGAERNRSDDGELYGRRALLGLTQQLRVDRIDIDGLPVDQAQRLECGVIAQRGKSGFGARGEDRSHPAQRPRLPRSVKF